MSVGSAGFWIGLLGPITSWVLTAAFTLWLWRLGNLNLGALAIGGMALMNGLMRAVPMGSVLLYSLFGRPYMEDEVGWGIWYVLRFQRQDLAGGTASFHSLLAGNPGMFLAEPGFWIPPLLSLSISLALLVPAGIHLVRISRQTLGSGVARWLFAGLPLITYFGTMPIRDWLDLHVRINW